MSLVLDLYIAHNRFGNSADPTLDGNLHYSNDMDRSLDETTVDKIRKYHSDYDNNSPNPLFKLIVTCNKISVVHSDRGRMLYSVV